MSNSELSASTDLLGFPALPGRTIDELTESQRESAIAAYRAAHEQDPDFGFAPDRAWVEGAAYVDALAAGQATVAQQGMTYAEMPDAPLPVFSKGPWTFKETGQNFSGAELDEAAFVAYRDRASHGQAPAEIMTLQEVWDAAGGNPRIKPTRDDVLLALKTLDEVCDEAALRASHGQAPAGESLRTDALCDLSYSHGLKAGWNYCASDDLSGFERAQKIGAEALRTLKSPTAQAAPAAVAGPSGYGPKVTVKRRCSDCKACNSESYAVQGDSGHYVYCEHPSLPERKYIGDTHWDTPDWCPAAAPTTQPAPQQEAQEPQEPFAWHVCSVNSDGSLSLEHAAAWEEAAHEHINDAITEHDIEGAGSWVVRPAYHAPQPSPAAQGDARYRLLNLGADVIQADDEFLSDDTTTWATDPNGVFVGMPYAGYALLPARRKVGAARAAQEGNKP